MKYIQVIDNQVSEISNVPRIWDDNNFCTPEALIKDGKAEQFGVVAVQEMPEPQYDANTQRIYCTYENTNNEWSQVWVIVDLTSEEISANRFQRDQARYTKRAAVKDNLIAYMAADNMSRVRSGAWTVSDLTGLMSDPAIAAAMGYMTTLSYELAAQAIQSAATPVLTAEIRANWIQKLQEHFYLEG